MSENVVSRIESRADVITYINNLKYALDNGAEITFQAKRSVDKMRDERFTNRFTVADLFPDEDPIVALRNELSILSEEEYMRTVKDLRFPRRSEMREFGRVYNGKDDVYIKIRVELLGAYGRHDVFVMSFHYAEKAFAESDFPYRNN